MAFVYFNPNPSRRLVGDCVIRGIAYLTRQSWEDTYIGICMCGFELHDMPSTNYVWEKYLIDHGFERRLLPDTCPHCYTVRHFCEEHPTGCFLLATGNHVVAVENGNYYDAWDSGDESPVYYWQLREEEN